MPVIRYEIGEHGVQVAARKIRGKASKGNIPGQLCDLFGLENTLQEKSAQENDAPGQSSRPSAGGQQSGALDTRPEP